MPLTVRSLFAALRADDGGRPRLVWYGSGGERVELSARVLENWVAKTANLLLEELDAGPATLVRVDLPPHWRTAVWTLATWAAGARLADAGPSESSGSEGSAGLMQADVLVTTPERAAAVVPGPRAQLVVVALEALAWSAAPRGTSLPRGALDYNASVAGFGDDLPPGGTDLDPVVAAGRPWTSTAPLALDAADYDAAALLATLAAGAGLVLLGPGSPDADRITAQERALRR